LISVCVLYRINDTSWLLKFLRRLFSALLELGSNSGPRITKLRPNPLSHQVGEICQGTNAMVVDSQWLVDNDGDFTTLGPVSTLISYLHSWLLYSTRRCIELYFSLNTCPYINMYPLNINRKIHKHVNLLVNRKFSWGKYV